VTHVVANPVTLETTERRLAFKHLDELPAIIRRLIGRDTTEFVDQGSGAGSWLHHFQGGPGDRTAHRAGIRPTTPWTNAC